MARRGYRQRRNRPRKRGRGRRISFQALLANATAVAARKRPPQDRPSLTHKFNVDKLEGYLTVGFYEDGKPADLFLRVGPWSEITGQLAQYIDETARSVSLALQHGMDLDTVAHGFHNSRLDPSGVTKGELKAISSFLAYVFRWTTEEELGKRLSQIADRVAAARPPAPEETRAAAKRVLDALFEHADHDGGVSASKEQIVAWVGPDASDWDIHALMLYLKQEGSFKGRPYFSSGGQGGAEFMVSLPIDI